MPVSGTLESERALTPLRTRTLLSIGAKLLNKRAAMKNSKSNFASLQTVSEVQFEERRGNMKIEQHFIPSAAGTREKELQD